MSSESSKAELHLHLNADLIPNFFGLLHQGFRLEVQAGCSIKSFLCEQLGLTPEYVEKRIQTIFLDGKPVDDTDSAIIRDGSTLALSALMPGLAGRVLRKGSHYASMRSTISHREETEPEGLQQGMIFLKLFNLMLRELGPIVLEKGVWIDGKDLNDFFAYQANDFRAGCKRVTVNNEEVGFEGLGAIEWADGQVSLLVMALNPQQQGGKFPPYLLPSGSHRLWRGLH